MRAANGAIGEHQGRLPAPAGASAALGVICRSRRHIAHVHRVQLGNIHPQFHGRRAEQHRQRALAKFRLPLLALRGRHLRRVLPGLNPQHLAGHVLVEMHEEIVGSAAFFRQARHADRVVESLAAVARLPDHHRCQKLVSRLFILTSFFIHHYFHKAGLFQSSQQLIDYFLSLFNSEPVMVIRESGIAPQKLSKAAARRKVQVAAVIILIARFWPGKQDSGMIQTLGFVFINRPGGNQVLVAELVHLFLKSRVQIIHLDRQFPAHVIQQHLCNAFAGLRFGRGQGLVGVLPDIVRLAQFPE